VGRSPDTIREKKKFLEELKIKRQEREQELAREETRLDKREAEEEKTDRLKVK
jgi:hypothetical protein